jgi:hypothetical protein
VPGVWSTGWAGHQLCKSAEAQCYANARVTIPPISVSMLCVLLLDARTHHCACPMHARTPLSTTDRARRIRIISHLFFRTSDFPVANRRLLRKFSGDVRHPQELRRHQGRSLSLSPHNQHTANSKTAAQEPSHVAVPSSNANRYTVGPNMAVVGVVGDVALLALVLLNYFIFGYA